MRGYILKDKDIKSSWISKALKKSSKKKQKLYIKFLKTKTFENYKSYNFKIQKLYIILSKTFENTERIEMGR